MTDEEARKSALLLQDLQHFGESLWRNDEIGEKRFSFFVTVMTAVIGGLVALYNDSPKVPVNPFELPTGTLRIMQGSMAALFLIALMTYFRMLQRNRVTRQYHATLDYIREQLGALGYAPAGYVVPTRPKRATMPFRAGLAESMALLCGMLLFALLVLLQPARSGSVVISALAGVLLFATLATIAHRR